jgi:uncharacterized protein YifE (UPF0438 family)
MAESFTTTNRFFDNKHYPRGFSRHGDFTIKELNCLSAMVMPLTSWIWVSVNLQPKTKNSLFLFAVVSVSRSLKRNVYGSSIWRALSVQSASIRCLAVSRRWKVQKTTPSLMTKKEGATAPFFKQLLQMQQQTIDSAVAQRLLQCFLSMSVHPPRQQWFWPLSANAATHV